MKKYSNSYFEKKYKILFDKLKQREGFEDEIKESRQTLGIPIKGFENEAFLAEFIISKLTKSEKETLAFFAFAQSFEREHKRFMTEDDREKVVNAFVKQGVSILQMMFEVSMRIQSHHDLFTNTEALKKSKKLIKLNEEVIRLMKKFWDMDLLDDHIIIHFVEKYLFLGEYGINQYIKNKVACHNCMYLGIEHFSPDRFDMNGDENGAIGPDYIFNERAVRRLSKYFDSVFIIIRPYATKEMALQYIKDNWDDLKDHIIAKNTFYKQLDINPSRLKESDNERNKLVYELYKNSKKELLQLYTGKTDFSNKGVYKESIISAILKEKYGVYMNNDAIKKTAQRYSKSAESKKAPKDIRDI